MKFHPLDQSKKHEILDAALSVFAEVGFKEATVRQICKKAKANVCLVSYYFGGKEGLYRAVFERVYQDKISLFDAHVRDLAHVQTQEEYRTRLMVYIEQLHERMSSNMDFFKVIQREMAEGLPRLEDMIKEFFSMTLNLLVEYFEYGQKQKYLKKEVDPQLAALGMMNLLSGFVQQEALNRPEMVFKGFPKKEVPEKINKVISTIFFDGVLQ